MTQAVTVRRDGDAFQARIFWLKAAALLDEDAGPLRVGFESGPKGFDDVWVEYDSARLPHDHLGKPLIVERLQCKWHVNLGTYSHVDLTRPEYINASTTSLLQRAHRAFRADRARGLNARVKLMTNHRVDQNDVLHGLIRTRSSVLDLAKLFAGKTAQSATGAARKLWREHLSVDEEELRELCGTLAFSHVAESLDELRERLDVTLRGYGLRPSLAQGSASIYDDLVFQWAGQGRLEFDRKSFRDACQREGLFAGKSERRVLFGVKSFEHPFDRLEDRCIKVVDLVPEFDERFIRDPQAWESVLQPKLDAFLREAARQEKARLRLVLDTHATLAFAAGSVLDTKSGRLVEIEQRSPDRRIWAPDDAAIANDWLDWEFSLRELSADGTGIAIAVSLARDVEPKVLQYLQSNHPRMRKLLVARLRAGASQQAVLGGAHAAWLVESLVRRASEERNEGRDTLHLFLAAPNAFTFYLGRHAAILKPVTLYEFDFEAQRDGSYQPSLSIAK